MVRRIRFPVTARRLVTFLLALSLLPAGAQEVGSSESLTPELLQSRILAVQDSTEVDDDTKTRLIELYRQSIARLELVRADQQATEEFRQALKLSPIEADSIRASIELRRSTDAAEDLQIASSTSAGELDERLGDERTHLAAAEAELAGLDSEIETVSQRPAQIRERIAAARSLVEEAEGQTASRLIPDGNPLLAEADRWFAATRVEALQTEILMLEEELRGQAARMQLLRTRRDETLLNVTRIARHVDLLRGELTKRRRGEAELAAAEAMALLEGDSAEAPGIGELAEANLLLVELLRRQSEELDTLSEQESRIRPLGVRLAEAFLSTRRKLELAGSRAPLGLAIRQQRNQLPDTSEYSQARRDLRDTLSTVSLRLIENEDERRALNDLESYLRERVLQGVPEPIPADGRGDLEALATSRRALLDRAIAADRAQQRRLHDLDDAFLALAERTTAYDEFLVERLLWVRSTRAVGLRALEVLPGEIATFFSPEGWRDVASRTVRGFRQAPGLAAIVLVAALLFLRRRRLHGALVECGRPVGRIRQDGMKHTIRALLYTVLLALPGPLVLMGLGWALATGAEASPVANGLALALGRTAIALFLLTTYRLLYEPEGVAARHFGWPRNAADSMRRQLGWFMILGLPLYFLTLTVSQANPATSGGTLGVLLFAAFMVAVTTLTIGLGHPTRGATRHLLESRPESGWWRWRHLWFPLVVAAPLAVTSLVLLGYAHTAAELQLRIFESVWLLTALWIGAALFGRWLLMTNRRLAYNAALQAREKARARREEGRDETGVEGTGSDEIDGPEVDLLALDAGSRKLLHAAILLLAILGLVGIWGDTVPALGFLEEVTLWHKTVAAEGAEVLAPVTLADFLLAALIGIVGYATSKNLPALVDILLLKQGRVTAGGRYATATLLRYTIAGVTILLVLRFLGATGSQMGWAVAALSVGIGFGVQEIVANFICGVILLYERPVRVGDVITIGDVSGRVTRIQIRATTIRDWELKELIVPNKELITGRLLNWTLSDSVTRVLLTVGVAYGSDVGRAMALLLEAARENDRVLDDPSPQVTFEQFADSSLSLLLRAYVGEVSDRLACTTELHREIDDRFRAAGIVIAFPQRDVHHHPLTASPAPGAGEAPAGRGDSR